MNTIFFSGSTGAVQRETGTSRQEIRSVQQKESGALGWQCGELSLSMTGRSSRIIVSVVIMPTNFLNSEED